MVVVVALVEEEEEMEILISFGLSDDYIELTSYQSFRLDDNEKKKVDAN